MLFYLYLNVFNLKNILMLELSKQVLFRVSFDENLFYKELKKSINWLKAEEVKKLKIWCLASFSIYNDMILEVFESVS